MLLALLERPGELLSREELCTKLWPAGTFVDFESGLNTATNRLRVALGDSAETPRYVETLPRLGYRFVCPVEEISESAFPHASSEPIAEVKPLPAIGALTSVPATAWVRSLMSWKTAFVILLCVIGLTVLLGTIYLHSKVVAANSKPVFQQLTFRTGEVGTARFSPDSDGVIYSAIWDSSEKQTYAVDLGTLTSRRLGFAPGMLAAVSPTGELVVKAPDPEDASRPARMLRIPLKGGSAAPMSPDVASLDWAKKSNDLALVVRDGLQSRVEFPSGHVVYRSQGRIDCLRVSPRGDEVAFLEHPVRDDSAGYVRIADRNRHSKVLTEEWNSAEGLAWSPSGSEVFFTASVNGAREALYAVSEAGAVRQISNTPSSLRLLDLSSNGRFLIASDDVRTTMVAKFAGNDAEIDLSRFDDSHVDDISPDGRYVLFTEGGDAGGKHYTAYLHDHKLKCTSRIGFGRGLTISPDEKWVLTIDPRDRGILTMAAIDSSVRQKVYGGGFSYQWAKFLPQSKSLLVGGNFPGKPLVVYVQRIEDSKLLALCGVPYVDYPSISLDGRRLAGLDAGHRMNIFELGKQPHQLFSSSNTFPVAWSGDGEDFFALVKANSGYQILKTNVKTKKSEAWKSISSGDIPGFAGLANIVAAPDVGAYAYSSKLDFSRLYLVDGWS